MGSVRLVGFLCAFGSLAALGVVVASCSPGAVEYAVGNWEGRIAVWTDLGLEFTGWGAADLRRTDAEGRREYGELAFAMARRVRV